jgi:predicted SAM-dependent methyltransferase
MEIGALWRRFPLRPGVRAWCLDRMGPEGLEKQYAHFERPILRPDIVGDAAALPVAAGSLDFLIASHVLEHMRFPLGALQHWYEALRPGGVLLLRIPDRRFTFDAKRHSTALQHLIDEHADAKRFDKRAHFEEWAEKVDGIARSHAGFIAHVQCLMEMDYSIHYHAWTSADIRELLAHTQRDLHLAWQPIIFWNAHFYRKETVALLRRD